MEDRKIIELYNYRSENALIETDKKYGKIVTFLICKLIKNTLDVEECRNDTYLGAWMTIPPIIPDNLKAYLLKIARNQALKKYEYIHAAKRDIDKCVPYEELSNYLAKEYMDDWRENELKEQIDAKSPGDTILVSYTHNGKMKSTQLKLGEASSN